MLNPNQLVKIDWAAVLVNGGRDLVRVFEDIRYDVGWIVEIYAISKARMEYQYVVVWSSGADIRPIHQDWLVSVCTRGGSHAQP